MNYRATLPPMRRWVLPSSAPTRKNPRAMFVTAMIASVLIGLASSSVRFAFPSDGYGFGSETGRAGGDASTAAATATAARGREDDPNNESSKGLGGDELIFDLYDDFDISSNIRGGETWDELCQYHRNLRNPRLSFYVDKVAQKRWLTSRDDVDAVPFHLARYASELLGEKEKDTRTGSLAVTRIRRVLDDVRKGRGGSYMSGGGGGAGDNDNRDFVAKVSHVSESNGVWVVKDKEDGEVTTGAIAASLVSHLGERAEEEESWALRNVRPGIVVERVFALWGDETTVQKGEGGSDDENEESGGRRKRAMPPFEFKVYVIWGRAYAARWRCKKTRGFVKRNGTMANWSRQSKGWRKDVNGLPEWLDWDRVVRTAERLARGKDMFRVDIFVGVLAGSDGLGDNATREERLRAVQYVVSECELFPTHNSDYKALQPEMARLWIEGYQMGKNKKASAGGGGNENRNGNGYYRVVPNPEVPCWFESRVLETSEKLPAAASALSHAGPARLRFVDPSSEFA